MSFITWVQPNRFTKLQLELNIFSIWSVDFYKLKTRKFILEVSGIFEEVIDE